LKKSKNYKSDLKSKNISISVFFLEHFISRKGLIASYEFYPHSYKNDNFISLNKTKLINNSVNIEEISYKIHHNLHEHSSNLFIDTLHLTSVLKILDNNYYFYSSSINNNNINSWCLAFFLFDKYYKKTNELYISFEILVYLIEKSKYFKKEYAKSYQTTKTTKFFFNNDKFETRDILKSTILIEK